MEQISKKSKIILYAASGMGINMLNLMVGSYICSALIAGGFGADAIPFQTFVGKDLVIPAVWAVFAFAAKVLDGIIDIPMASFADNLKSRWGRRKPAIFGGFVLTVIFYLLMLVIPNPNGATLGNTIYYGIMLCGFYAFYTLTMVTYYATYTEIVGDVNGRNAMSNAKSVYDIIYFILGYVVVRMLLNGLNIRIVALIVLPIALTMIIPMFMIKEPSNLDSDVEEKAESISLIQSLVYTFKDKDYIKWLLVYSAMTFAVQLFLGGINEYFSFVGMNMMFVMIAAFGPVPFTLPIYTKLIKKRGFEFAYMYSMLIYSAAMLGLFFIGKFMPDGTGKTIGSIIGGLICSFGIGAIFSVAYSIPAELAAQDAKRTGISKSAMYFAVQGLFSGVASGIGTGIVLTALKSSKHADAITYMTLIVGLGTLAACLCSMILPKSIKNLGKEE